jgi:RNA polymerase sigma factor (sigma-70 family)
MATPYFVTGQLSKDIARDELVIPTTQLNALAILAGRGNEKALAHLTRGIYRSAIALANFYAGKEATAEELLGEAMLGVPDAVRTYDASRNVDFSLHANQWMRAKITKFLDCNNPVRINDPKKVKKQLKKDGETINMLSTSTPLTDDGLTMEDSITFSVNCETFADVDCRKLLANLPEQERKVLEMVYLKEMTYEEASDSLGISKQYVNIIAKKAIERLSHATRIRS